jgi:hypothetical protein
MGGEGGLNRGNGGWGKIFKEDGCGKERQGKGKENVQKGHFLRKSGLSFKGWKDLFAGACRYEEFDETGGGRGGGDMAWCGFEIADASRVSVLR